MKKYLLFAMYGGIFVLVLAFGAVISTHSAKASEGGWLNQDDQSWNHDQNKYAQAWNASYHHEDDSYNQDHRYGYKDADRSNKNDWQEQNHTSYAWKDTQDKHAAYTNYEQYKKDYKDNHQVDKAEWRNNSCGVYKAREQGEKNWNKYWDGKEWKYKNGNTRDMTMREDWECPTSYSHKNNYSDAKGDYKTDRAIYAYDHKGYHNDGWNDDSHNKYVEQYNRDCDR